MARSKDTAQREQSKRRAARAGLVYVNDFDKGIHRRRCGRGFTYSSPHGRTLRSQRDRKRIDNLAIPPAWEEVWICPNSKGHIQARGRDEAGRTQYIYHERWQAVSAATKFDRMHLMPELLPRIRRRVRRDLDRGRQLTKPNVLAAVVRLIDKAYIRVGNERYAEERDSRGATTITSDHVDVNGFQVSLDFPGKSGQRHEVELRDKKVAKVIEQCEELDGQFLFTYRRSRGRESVVTSTDVNEYLQEISHESITAKDFRTWWGSVLTLGALAGKLDGEKTQAERKRAINAAIDSAAESLGNTKAVCRESYVHPAMIAAANSGELIKLLTKIGTDEPIPELTVDETRFAKLLRIEFHRLSAR